MKCYVLTRLLLGIFQRYGGFSRPKSDMKQHTSFGKKCY
ncbi:Uncharacterised protein [Salmonella enterica subsp. arizonae]|uniref:Uncharacterized protein n=1 Tax=Salmonella enterica subsp. arizonae TaxID=59203 RepID=A0A379S565_SALER|nr:Uncharacterised protein [Salmonella enterica subsp. arizonae]